MKNRISYFLFPLLSTICLLACKREPAITKVSGVVTEYGTGKPISNVEVFVLCNTSDPFGPQLPGNLVDTMFTDAQGRFYREYPEKDFCLAAYLAFYKPGYYVHNDVDISTGENYFEVVLDPEAWLKIVTIPDLGGNGVLVAGSNYYGGSGYYSYSHEGEQYNVFLTKGNEQKYLRWYTGNNYEIKHQDTIFLNGRDTTTYTIHY